MIPFPDKKYDIIYADPPWQHKGKVLRLGSQASDRYDLMSFEDIERLPVLDIAKDDCLLFMWVISPDLLKCIKVGEKWGFRFVTVGFVWEKDGILPSNYTLSSCELCLIFKRGKIPQPRGKRNIRQFLSCKRGRHSEKPKEIRHRITEMFPSQAKIELFARPNWTDYDRGWDYWGNEV